MSFRPYLLIWAALAAAGVLALHLNNDPLPKLNSTDASTLIAGFGGVLVGGLISYLLAMQASAETLRRDAEQRTETELSDFLRLTLKAMQIANSLYTTSEYIEIGARKADEEGAPATDLWQYVQQATGHALPPPSFEAAEFIPLLKSKQADLVNRLSMVSLRHAVNESAFAVYSDLRGKLQELLLPYSAIAPDGRVVTAVPNPPPPQIPLKIAELNSLLLTLRSHLAADLKEANALCDALGQVGRDYFGRKAMFVLSAPGGQTSS